MFDVNFWSTFTPYACNRRRFCGDKRANAADQSPHDRGTVVRFNFDATLFVCVLFGAVVGGAAKIWPHDEWV